MKNLFFLLVICFCFGFTQKTQAQSFDHAIGARLGYPVSISYKKFVSESAAFEAYAGTRGYIGYRWVNASVAYQKHTPIEVPGLEWYWGVGASAYFYTFEFINDTGSLGLGAQGYLGLQYTFDDVPVNVSLDWVPTVFLTGYISGAGLGYGSLAVRYVLD